MVNEFIDDAYKTGAGRYLQQRGALSLLGDEVKRLGSKPFVLGGPRSLPIVRDAVVSSLATASATPEVRVYDAHPTREDARALGEEALDCGCDVVVGVGGGRMMDAAKAVACSAGLPIVEVPTCMATCAAFSPLSVMYKKEGGIGDTWRYTSEVDAVIVDLDVMAHQPPRLVAAGILDAYAKVPEIDNGGVYAAKAEKSVQRFAAYQYARVNNELIQRYGVQAYKDVVAGQVTDALERMAFTTIALTGIVSALTRGFHQTALAHRLQYGFCEYYGHDADAWLHGEVVAIGLLMQLVYNGTPEQAPELRAFMRSMDMPCTLAEIGVFPDDERFEKLRDYVKQPEFVGNSQEDEERFHRAFESIAE